LKNTVKNTHNKGVKIYEKSNKKGNEKGKKSHKGQHDWCRQIREKGISPCSGKSPHVKLAFSSNIPELHFESNAAPQ
jgi:hypothetical protein